MSIVEDFDNLHEISYNLMHLYWDISDNYRGLDLPPELPNKFEEGKFQFIETDEGKRLENKLSALTDQVNSIIDEIIAKLNEDVIVPKEDTDTINGSMKYFANNYKSIDWKNWWFGEHKMDLNERAKLNGYFEKLRDKAGLLNKVLTEKKDTLNIMSVNKAFESNMKELENDPVFMSIIKGKK
jgi:hypothetical protein